MQFRRISKVVPARFAPPVICLALIAYFGFHGLHGDRGLKSLWGLQARAGAQLEELDRLDARRQVLQRRVDLISGPAVDGDLLDEQVRRMFGWTAPGEIIIYRNERGTGH